MTNAERLQLWDEFLEAWPLERVRNMSLEEYTNPDRNDAFIYWLEAKLGDLGSIWGGSAFKFGIYYRDNKDSKLAGRGRTWGDEYAWATRLGKTESEAFGKVRSLLIDVIEAVQNGNLPRVEDIELAPVLKWKVAFLYQNREKPLILPIFSRDMLFYYYRSIDPTAKKSKTPRSVMYPTLLERHKALGNVFDIGVSLWSEYEAARSRTVRAWAVPLDMASEEEVSEFCANTRIETEDVDPFLANILSAVELAEGDLLAFMTAGEVRAVGTITSAGGGENSWDQIPLQPFPSGLLVAPQFEVKELTAAEREEIWSHVPKPEVATSSSPRYWKIAPGRNAIGWPEWRDNGIASIGWPELGDLTGVSKSDFDTKVTECEKNHQGYKKKGMNQVWTFRSIKTGDHIVANSGQSKIVGTGIVTEGYRYSPGWHIVEGEDYPHQVKVKWDSVVPQKISQQQSWLSALIEISKDTFDEILNAPILEGDVADEAASGPSILPPPCRPQNIILYGPPGTGKTYSTARRALELILPDSSLDELSDENVMRVFREKQSQGQVEFVTFHQSYGYEEFVEGLRPVLDVVDGGGEVKYELHDGVFKRIALRAAAEGLLLKDEAPGFEMLWSQLLKSVELEEDRIVPSISGTNYIMRVTSRRSLRIYPCEQNEDGSIKSISESYLTASRSYMQLMWERRNELGLEPDEVTAPKTTQLFARELGTSGGCHYTALWIAYRELLQLSRSAAGRRQELTDPSVRVQHALDRPSAGAASFGFSANTCQYVLIIDEINRGNISKILGELITLLEPDKRLGTSGELKLPLSYSPTHKFTIPPNLHVIGTMNTADRSIALMDVALRRRFSFEELMPDSGIIRQVLEKEVTSKALIDLVVDVFETLNSRIRFVYDRDHQLGHAYFLGVRSLDDLRLVFVDRVIPLLQEYFYGAWDKICLVLGCPYSDGGKPERNNPVVKDGRYIAPIISATIFEEEVTLGFNHDEYEDRLDHCVTDRFNRGKSADEVLLPYFLGALPDAKYAEHKGAFGNIILLDAASSQEPE